MIVLVLIYALQIYSFIVLARVLLTWVPNLDYSNPIVRFLHEITEPVLQPIREMLPRNEMGIDFSPMVVFLLIFLVTRLLVGL